MNIWVDEYDLTNPVVLDSAYTHTGYMLPKRVSIPAETLLEPGIVLTENPTANGVSDDDLAGIIGGD